MVRVKPNNNIKKTGSIKIKFQCGQLMTLRDLIESSAINAWIASAFFLWETVS
jgi:hypothetical protein